MRFINVLSLLSTLLVLEGCAGLAVSESQLSVDERQPVERPMTFRTLGWDQQFSEVSSVTAAEQLRAVHAGKPLTILALSGGGAGGAFGAGAVAGLTRTGTRAAFDVVTGVSAGALVAPFAFLGPTWDGQLLDAFTGVAGDNLLQPRGLSLIFGSSVYSGRPLRQLIDTYVSDEMIRAIAREAAKGRLLLVATTDVASGEWRARGLGLRRDREERRSICQNTVSRRVGGVGERARHVPAGHYSDCERWLEL